MVGSTGEEAASFLAGWFGGGECFWFLQWQVCREKRIFFFGGRLGLHVRHFVAFRGVWPFYITLGIQLSCSNGLIGAC